MTQSKAEEGFGVAIVIVGYRNADDIRVCLEALRTAEPRPSFEIFIAENGGPTAFDALVDALNRPEGPCTIDSDAQAFARCPQGARHLRLRLAREDGVLGEAVNIAEMPDNLGYGGGVNAWLRPLLQMPGWSAAWVLNPDTLPARDALAELQAYASKRGKGLVGSRLVPMSGPDCVLTRGLAWSNIRATALAIDMNADSSAPFDIESVERRLDAPSGASVYATRALIERIGLMREDYFLYGEDLEWGVRAKKLGATVGYAHKSIVRHIGGSTIGSSRRRRNRSTLSTYLLARNRILFVREHHPGWLFWSMIVSLAEAAAYAVEGAFLNTTAEVRGLAAGLRGETGKPIDR